ncbi:E3 ubiquitin-protein ligase [Canna indica]|uniref:E3 ubiquitin-protein ligase n=1 Tax=Canna indica TaxID=4628 RepID=A0AAQ3JNJ3_9LILI|nr:E3 ubiquitin-protein ligase [Canna indica]
MGSGNSRMASRSPRFRTRGRPRLGLTAFLCGGAAAAAAAAASSSADPPQIEDKPAEKSVIQARLDGSVLASNIQITVKESSPNFSQENSCSSSTIVDTPSTQNNDGANWDHSLENSCLEMFRPERTSNLPSTSRKAIENADSTLAPVSLVAKCTNEHGSCSSPKFSSSINQLELGDLHANETLSTVNPSNEVVSIPNRTMDYVPGIPISSTTSQFSSEEPLVANTFGSDASTSIESSEQRNGSVLHVDLVSISSDVPSGEGEISSESRRNTRRLFWDAFSRQTSRTVDSTPVLSSPDTSALGYQDRWLLDIGEAGFEDGVGDDSVYLRRRRRGLNGVSWHSRTQIRERLRSGFRNNEGRQSSCPSGLHQDGACSCTLLMTEVSSTRASIARIFVLAEALFEVLDEIHRQPGPVSLSMVSAPAPESVVGSMPTKIYKKVDTFLSSDEVDQCYICLADYEDGDTVRILPCHHEYHKRCVDKWLKEIHGVCPLCRHDVTEDVTAS